MHRLRLSALLVGANLALVLLAVVIIGFAAARRLERLADEQALARVALAGASAAHAVDAEGETLAISTRLLAERPTLGRLIDEGNATELVAFLDRFRRTGQLSGCAVVRDGTVLAAAGQPLPWTELWGARGIAGGDAPASGGAFLTLAPAGELLFVASAAVPGASGAFAAGATFLDRGLAERLSEGSGLPVRIIAAAEILQDGADPRAPLRQRVRLEGVQRQKKLREAKAYVDVRPLMGAGPDPLGVLEVELSRDSVTASLNALESSLAALALATMGVAIAGSILLARWLSGPLKALTTASRRIGAGDLATPIPPTSGAEMGALAASMEEMRGRLRALTSELRSRQAEAEAILTGVVEGVFAVDLERRIRYVNPQLAALLGVRVEEALGQFCGDLLRPRDLKGERPCEGNCPIIHARFRGTARSTEHLLLQDGSMRSVVITSAAADLGSSVPGKERQFQVLRDETEIEAGRRLRDTLLANISHEFRTPLSAQLASIELLRERLPDLPPEEVRQLVASIERGVLRLTHLIDNLLESVRIEAGHDSIRRNSLALDEVVEEAVEMTAPLMAQRRQRLEIDLPFPLAAVSGDAQRLTQVFVNLLANASKYAHEGSVIRVGGSPGPDGLLLWVEDEGPGLPEEARDSVFERFVRWRPGAEREPDAGGMGLGLWIVKSIVERHGGRVEARGRPDGIAGTRFVVILPREAA